MNFERKGSCDQKKMLFITQILQSLYNFISTLEPILISVKLNIMFIMKDLIVDWMNGLNQIVLNNKKMLKWWLVKLTMMVIGKLILQNWA